MKIKRKEIIILAFFCCFIAFSHVIYAFDIDIITSAMDAANQFPSGVDSKTGLSGLINRAIGLLQVAGTGIAVIVVTVLGIKYITASVEQKAEIKKQAIPIVIGCILVFGGITLISAILTFSNTLFYGGTP